MGNSVYVAFDHQFKDDNLSASDIAFLASVYSTVVVYNDANTDVFIMGKPFEPKLSKGARYIISELLQSNDLSDIVNKYNDGSYDAEEVEKELAEWMKS